MYANLYRRRLRAIPGRVAGWVSGHSALLAALLVLLLVAGAVIAVREKGHGHLSRLKSELQAQRPAEPPPPILPGGQEAIVLQRTRMAGSTMPEFLSATLLPGRGMNVLQITAYLPDTGEVKLLDSPELEEFAKQLTAAGEGAGVKPAPSADPGAPLELPWAGRIAGARTAEGTTVAALWHGHNLILPANDRTRGQATASSGGLLFQQSAFRSSSNVMPDGGEAQATYHTDRFEDRWPSSTDVVTTVLLSGRVLEIRVVAHNVGPVAEPMGIGWHPRFAILSGDRSQVTLHLPSSLRVETQAATGLPTGQLQPVTGTAYDFTGRDGVPLRSLALDESFARLRPALLDIGPTLELRDPKSNYGLRMTMMTPSIRAIHIQSAGGSNSIVIDPQTNLPDPLGREWTSTDDPGITVLEPGKTLQWRVRLELFTLAAPLPPGL